ncbi:RICIN domain-containing protein [Pseudoalteromonas luteoviolacea]|uniref:RICIN domain-containing protein n=1 Tax=Pseudoalteromonas luteoviolacea TaxID=43657 RepID=UPI001F298131|nr:RICIN domain-containing protein [Pseudoalteromonas luteoviolacea]MCF6442819.1 RICIN domain-containing protein [Pseudoalteromonas luteoviolacea]
MGSRKGIVNSAVVASVVAGSMAMTSQANAFGWGSIGDFFKDPIGTVGGAVSQVAQVVRHVTSPVTTIAIDTLRHGANVVNSATNLVGVDSSAITNKAISLAQQLATLDNIGTFVADQQQKLAALEHFATVAVTNVHHLGQLEALVDGVNENNVEVARTIVHSLIKDIDYNTLKQVVDQVKTYDGAQSLMFMVNKGNLGVGVAVDVNELERIKYGHRSNRHEPIMSFFVQAVNPGTPNNQLKFSVGYHKNAPLQVSGNSVSLSSTVKKMKVSLAFASLNSSDFLALVDIQALRNQHKMTAIGVSANPINLQAGSTSRQVVFKECQNGRLQANGVDCNQQDLSISALTGVHALDQHTALGGVSFTFKSFGKVDGMYCVQTVEPADPHTWHDNYFCSSQDLGMKWSYAGPIDGMRCTQIIELADPHTWQDNYLCLPNDSDYLFSWNSAGKGNMKNTVRWLEAADPHTWNDNYLGIEKHVEMKLFDRCLDIAGYHPSNGQDIMLHDCHNGANQKWLFTNDGKVRSKVDYNKCLDYRNSATSNGEKLMVWDCNTSPTQQFEYINGQLKTVLQPSRCVDAPAPHNFTRTHLWDCPVLTRHNNVVISN